MLTYGKEWLIRALPKPIYQKINNLADDHKYELAITQEELTEDISAWDFITLSDCRTIALSGSHWSTMFESCLIRPEETNTVGNKEIKTKWLIDIETISNKLEKASYSVSSQEWDLINSVHHWLCKNT